MSEKKALYAASNVSHIESYHGPYIEWLNDRGWKVYSLCGGEAKVKGIHKHINLGFTKSLFSVSNFIVSLKLAGIIRAEGFDLIWVHTSLAAFFVRLAVILAGKGKTRVINTVHGYLFDDKTSVLKKLLLTAAEKLTAPVTDLIMTMNSFDYNIAVKNRLAKKIVNIDGVGVNFNRFIRHDKAAARRELGLKESAFIMIYPAEFSERKNQRFLIENIKNLPEETFLILPGKGALLEACRQLAIKAGVGDRVSFPGHITDLSLYYSAADISVSSSRSEGLPFNIMEAMYMFLPSVSTNVKGHEDLIIPGKNGYLYDYGDGEKFCAYVRQLLADRKLREAMGEAAHSSVLKYSLENVFHQIVSLIE